MSFKEEYIAKFGEEKYKQQIKRTTEWGKKRMANPLRIENGVVFLSFDFFAPLPEKEKGMAASQYRYYAEKIGEDNSIAIRKKIINAWANKYKGKQAIVIVEPKVQPSSKRFRYRVELYSLNINKEVQEWLATKIAQLEKEQLEKTN